jgi:Rieske Fe-S protein
MEINVFSRRNFLLKVALGAMVLGVLSPFIGTTLVAMSKSLPTPMNPIAIDLTLPEYNVLTKVGGALKIPNPKDSKNPIIVHRISEVNVVAFSSRCSHFGCEVTLPEENIIKCPCHGSVFDGSGKVISGPTRKDLEAFFVIFEGTTLTIR